MTYDTIAIPGGFIKLMRSDATRELLRDGPAFQLLTQIALRAKRTNDFNVHGLQIGQALIGDYASCGLTRRKYRTAMAHLERYGLARFQATHRGTIATLLDITIYDINEEQASPHSDQRPANKRPTEGHQAATIKNEKNEKKEKKGPPVCFSGSGPGVRSATGGLPTFAEMDRQRAACALAKAQEEFLNDDQA
ncbi:hypothetical protein [Anaerobaca lacustris]|uniref:Replication protein n=1 Tax=Anaerobaca lacustris TaxID=3044600 RepID=A0AAW6TXD3_9BACT|nr:hypothetical protein [Sedimentisphaerales bacterium M17dextr]